MICLSIRFLRGGRRFGPPLEVQLKRPYWKSGWPVPNCCTTSYVSAIEVAAGFRYAPPSSNGTIASGAGG